MSAALRRILAAVALAWMGGMTLAPGAAAAAAFCAVPGNDGPGSIAGIVNTYYAGTSASIVAGATSIGVGAINAAGASKPIQAGDLLLIVQMQDAAINRGVTVVYGDGSTGSGATTYGRAGNYEYVQATAAVSGGAVTIKGAGAGNGTVNSYGTAAATGTQGQSRYQIIRVPQYSVATVAGTLSAAAWNGVSGGVIAIDVAGTLTISGSIDVSALGFRGGAGRALGGNGTPTTETDYRSLSSRPVFGSKGEGAAGTPQYLYDIPTATLIDTGIDGYPSGSSGRGAPGNAGGGGNDSDIGGNGENAGGGGGSNGGRGGVGGNTWSTNLPYGGLGGGIAPNAASKLFMGGGGGAGSRNNSSALASSGGAGGGVIMVRAGDITGSGVLRSNGSQGIVANNDGGGGSGAGGSILAYTGGSFGAVSAQANGAGGGNNDGGGANHGPGGGGGGGFVVSNTPLTTSVTGGIAGYTVSVGNNYSARAGLSGTASSSLLSTAIVGATPSNLCVPVVTVTKTASPAAVVNSAAGTNTTYTIKIANAAGRGVAQSVVLSDTLPSGFTYVSGASVAFTGGAAGSSPPVNSGSTTVPVLGTFTIPGGGSLTLTVPVAVAAAVTNGVYANVGVAQYQDPVRAVAGGIVQVSSAAANVTVTAAPTISGTVYLDTNHNGSLDASESGGLAGLFVKLTPLVAGSCTSPAAAAYAVDPTTGFYQTASTAAGSYCLILSNNAALATITPAVPAGYIGIEAASGIRLVSVNTSPLPIQNFGLFSGSSITGRIFIDNGNGGGTAHNGALDGGETGVASTVVTLYNGTTQAPLDATVTDGAGNYRFYAAAPFPALLAVNPTLTSNYLATGGTPGNSGGAYQAAFNVVYWAPVAGVAYTGLNLGMVPYATLQPDQSNQTSPGTTLYYPHQFVAGSPGMLSLSTVAVSAPVTAGFTETLLLDATCSGIADASAPPISAPIGVATGQRVCFLVKEFVPATAKIGTQNAITLSAQMTLSGSGAKYVLTRTDTTVVAAKGDVVLSKLVRNVTAATAFTQSNAAAPNDVIEYRMAVFNPSTNSVTAIVVSDATPFYTAFVAATCPGALPAGVTSCAVTAPAVGASGSVQWTFTGSLRSGDSLVVTFQVRINP